MSRAHCFGLVVVQELRKWAQKSRAVLELGKLTFESQLELTGHHLVHVSTMPGVKQVNQASALATPPVAGPSKLPVSSHFNTLDRENGFRHPNNSGSKYPAPQQLVAPHIDSFDALFEGAPIGPHGEVDRDLGLLDLAINDLQPKVIFDGQGPQGTLGNRLERELDPGRCSSCSLSLGSSFVVGLPAVKIDNLAVARPMASAKGPDSRDRLIYPSEVSRRLGFVPSDAC